MGYSRYIGRVGALAVMLGVGAAVATPGIALAEGEGSAPSGGAGSSQESPGTESDPGEGDGLSPGSPSGEGQPSSEDDEDESDAGNDEDETDEGDDEGEEEVAEGDDGAVVSPAGDDGVEAEPVDEPWDEGSESRKGNDSYGAEAPDEVTVSTVETVEETTVETPEASPEPAATVSPLVEQPVVVVADTTVVQPISTPTGTPTETPSVPVPEAATVLTSLFSPSVSGGPQAPVDSPLLWALFAAARREVGSDGPPVAAVEIGVTGEVDTTQMVTVAAAADPDLGVIIIDPLTGAVSGTIVPPGDPAGANRKPSYTVTVPPGVGHGTFTINKTNGAFTYTPTAAQRVLAGFSVDPEDTVAVTVTATYGSTKVAVVVNVPVDPVSITDIGEVASGEGAYGLAVTNDRAYVTNYDAGTVTVIDTIHGAVIDDIDVVDWPIGVVVTPDGKKLYVSSQDTYVVSVIDAASRTVVATISLGDNEPQLMAISPDGKTIYVTTAVYDDEGFVVSSGITKISTSTNKVTGTVANVGLVPYGITVSPDGKKIYVISEIESDTEDYRSAVFVFSSTATKGTQILGVGEEPEAVAVSRDNKLVYIGDFGSGTISVVNATTNAIVSTINADPESIDEIAVHPSNTMLMVFNYQTHAIDLYEITDNYAYMGSVETNATTEANFPEARFSPDGQQLYFTSDGHLQVVSLVPTNEFPVVGAPTPGAPVPATGAVTGGYGVSDPDGDRLSYVLKSGPAQGKVVLNADGTWTYTPTAAARHEASAAAGLTDSFVVTVSDGRRGIVEQIVVVDISPTNKAPVIKQSVGSPNATTGVVAVTVSATDADRDVLTFTGTDPAHGTGSGVNGKYVYTPTAAARHAAATVSGGKTDSFTVTVDDGHGSVQTITVNVRILPKNSAPVSTASLGPPDEGSGAIIGTVHTTDADGDGVTLTGPTTTAKGTITYDSVTDEFTYTPTAAARTAAAAPKASTAAKTDKFTVTINDGHGGTDTIAFTVNIMAAGNENPENGAVVVGAPSATTGAIKGTVTADDPNGDVRTYGGSQTTSKGKVTVASNGSFTYTPTTAARHAASAGNADPEDKQDTFNVTINDGKGGFLSVPVTVTITPQNAAPKGNFTASKPNTVTGAVTGTVKVTDADKDVPTYTGSITTAKGTFVVAANGGFTYTPTAAARHAALATGATAADKTDNFIVTVNDGHGAAINVPVTVSIGGLNAKPTSATAAIVATSTTTGRIKGAVTVVDGDDSTFSYTVPAKTKKGAIVVNADGTFSYTPTAAARDAATNPNVSTSIKTDSFTVTVLDNHGGAISVNVTVNIVPSAAGNRTPVVGAKPYTVTVDVPSGVVTGQLNVSDPDGKPLVYALAAPLDPAKGSVSVNSSTGSFTFTPTPATRYHAWFTAGEDTVGFTMTAFDGKDAAIVDIAAPVSPLHPDVDGSLSTDDLKFMVADGVLTIAENDSGGVSAIDGTFTSSIVSNETQAAAVLNSLAQMLNTTPGFASPASITTQTAGGEKFYRMAQTVNGIPVLGSQVVLVTDADGTVTGVFSGYNNQVQTANTVPSTTFDQAAEANAIAAAALKGRIPISADPAEVQAFLSTVTYETDLVVYALDSEASPSLAWRVNVMTNRQTTTGLKTATVRTYYIYANGANAGAILAEKAPLSAASVNQSAYGYSFVADSASGGAVLIDSSRNIETVRITQEWNFFGIHWGVFDTETIRNQGGWSRNDVAVHANMADVYDYYKRVLQRDSFDGQHAPIIINVNAVLLDSDEVDGTDNAWWSSAAKKFAFGTGGHERALDVVGHEFTHGVIQFVVGGGGKVWENGESGALGEAYGDILGSLIEGKPRYDDERWLFGEDSDADNGRIALRSMADPSAFTSGGVTYLHDYDPDHIDGYDEHISSTIFSHAAYRMIMDPQEGSVRGWGRTASVTDEQWAKVFYNSLHRLPANADFVDARSAVISSAKAQGFTQTQIEAIQDAFDHVGITATNYRLGAYDTVNLCSGSCEPKDLAASASGNRAFVIVGNTVKIVETNAAPDRTVATVTVGSNPTGIAVNNNGSRAYVTNTSSGTVSIIQKLFGTNATATVTTVTVGSSPSGVGVNAAGTRAYVANSSSGTVSIIDYTFDGTSAPTVRTVTVGSQPTKVAVSADGTRAFVSNTSSGTVSVITYNGGTPTVETISVGSGPREVVVSADGTRALVYGASGSVYVINAASGTAASSARVPGNFYSYTDFSYTEGFIALSADGTRGFVTDHDARLMGIIDTATPNPTVRIVNLGSTGNDYPHSVATTANGSRAFVVTHDKLYVVDGRTGVKYFANIPVAINNNASDFQQVAVSSNGAYVIATDINGKLTILNATAF